MTDVLVLSRVLLRRLASEAIELEFECEIIGECLKVQKGFRFKRVLGAKGHIGETGASVMWG